MPAPRVGAIERTTKETGVRVRWALEGSGRCEAATGIGMLDHMMEQLAKHGGFDIEVSAKGDLHVDSHHTVEDIGLCLGKALSEALGERRGIRRFGDATVPLDEALVVVAVDLGGRPYAAIDLPFSGPAIGELSSQLVPHLFESLANEARMSLHVRMLAGDNDHHCLEAAFKALARALADAVAPDSRYGDAAPSTKGVV